MNFYWASEKQFLRRVQLHKAEILYSLCKTGGYTTPSNTVFPAFAALRSSLLRWQYSSRPFASAESADIGELSAADYTCSRFGGVSTATVNLRFSALARSSTLRSGSATVRQHGARPFACLGSQRHPRLGPTPLSAQTAVIHQTSLCAALNHRISSRSPTGSRRARGDSCVHSCRRLLRGLS